MDVNYSPPSLRKRYIIFTIALSFFVLTIVSVSYSKMVSLKNDNLNSYAQILDEQGELEKLRHILLQINHNINLFLLDPSNEQLTLSIDAHTNQAIQNLLILQTINSDHVHHQGQAASAQTLENQFQELRNEIKKLIAYRLDINKQYPGMDINANIMEPQQDSIKSKLQLLQLEIESGGLKLRQPEVYPLILKTQSLWVSAISQTRIYMTNRLATFSVEVLVLQGKSLEDIYDVLLSNITTLQNLYKAENSFEGQELLADIEQTVKSWHDYFLQVRNISESDRWRTDTLLMKTKVFPVINEINSEIKQLEHYLKVEEFNNEEAISQSNQTFNGLILSIIGIFFLFIFAILKSLDWMVFIPVKKVTKALKTQPFSNSLPHLEAGKTKEINDLISAFIEMEEEVTQRQRDLEYQAMHDHLTGLPNRLLLNQCIEYQILSSEKKNNEFALFLMDLDFFKDINDTLGHATGDELLIGAAQRIQSLISKSDTLARLGGDEFAILLPDCSRAEVLELATKIIEKINEPFELDQGTVNIAISIGAVYYPTDGKTVETLLQYADMAMYTAKRKRTGYAEYNPADNIYSKEHLSLINDLPIGIEQDLLELYFQPQIDVSTNKIIGAEALLRWNHDIYGFIPPENIIEAAERTGLLHKLTLNIIEKALQECRKWQLQGFHITVAVNLSTHDLADRNLSKTVAQLLDKYKVGYNQLTLEVTESAMMENLTLSLQQLNQLHDLGINLSVDDFGTGFSSLAYLKRLPVNELKIDKSFIVDLATDEDDKNIVNSTINLGHNLGLKVVTEGVETEEVLAIIQAMNCDFAQGYFISKPMPAKAFLDFLKTTQFAA